jgi:chaperonin GroEL
MIEEGEKAIREKGFNVIQLAEELKKGSDAIVKALQNQKEEINDNKKIQEVATLSAKDAEIGKLIAEIISKVGRDGVITIEDSNTIGNSYELVEGMQFDRGYISQYMVTNQERMEAVLEDPYVLVTDKKISAIGDLLPLLEKVVQSGKKELLIVAEEVDGEALATIVVNKIRGIFNILTVKAPGFGDRKKEMLQDIAAVVGANLISEELGKKIESIELNDLGHAHRVVANKDKTINAQIKTTDSDFDKEKLEERLGKLAGGVAVIKVGAPTESAQKELKQRVEDAVAATRAAMEEGIVPGGGIALFNVYSLELKNDDKNLSPVEEAAHKILRHATEAPLSAIVANSGENPGKIIDKLKNRSAGDRWKGFNAFKNDIDDLKAAGIIDPLKVTKIAFTNAVSVAATYLTIGAGVTEIPKKEENPPAGMPGGMGGY